MYNGVRVKRPTRIGDCRPKLGCKSDPVAVPRAGSSYPRVIAGECFTKGTIHVRGIKRVAVGIAKEGGRSTVCRFYKFLQLHEEMAGRVGIMYLDGEWYTFIAEGRAVRVTLRRHRIDEGDGSLRVDPNHRALQRGKRVPKSHPIDLPRELIERHKGRFIAVAYRPFGLTEAGMVEDGDEGAPREAKPCSGIIDEAAQRSAHGQVEQVAVLRVSNGFLAPLQEGIEPMALAIVKGEGTHKLTQLGGVQSG